MSSIIGPSKRLTTTTDRLTVWLQKHGEHSRNVTAKEKVVADFARCNDEQASLVLAAVEVLQSHYDNPVCIRYSAKSTVQRHR